MLQYNTSSVGARLMTDELSSYPRQISPIAPDNITLSLLSLAWLGLGTIETLEMAKDRNGSIPAEEEEEAEVAEGRGDRHRKSKRREEEEESGGEDDSGADRARSKKKRRRHRSSRKGHRRRSRGSSETDDSASSDSYTESETEQSGSESESEAEQSEDEARRRRRKERRRRREREYEKERRRKKEREKARRRRRRKEEKDEKKGKKLKDKKKKEKEVAKKGAVTNSWGKYGIIKEIDMWNKRPEFTAWLAEVKLVNLETLSNWEEKQMFKEFMEDHNTATFPSKKYYDLDAYHQHKMEKEMKKGLKKVQETERTVFNDEEQRRIELLRDRERQKEEQVEALRRSMQTGMAQAMKEQSRLREEMMYQYKLGNFEAAAAIQRRLDPDVAM